MAEALAFVEADALVRHFDVSPPWIYRVLGGVPRQILKAVDGVGFHIRQGETFGLVGESGCGKSTLARLIVGLHDATSGRLTVGGAPVESSAARRRACRTRVQMIFQDPYASLNPRMRIESIVAEPIVEQGLLSDSRAIRERVLELLAAVGLSAGDVRRFPHALSGGQRQRVSIARALAGAPELLICDEPTSSLDVSVQAQILNLMRDLQERHRLTMLFISHNLAVVGFMSDRVGVMYLGRICEVGRPESVFVRPLHPYSQMLVDSVPSLSTRRRARRRIVGELPSPINPPTGCAFHPRCAHADERCRHEPPALRPYGASWAACHAVEEGRLPNSMPI